jgi:hypothetical protein
MIVGHRFPRLLLPLKRRRGVSEEVGKDAKSN